MSAQLEKQYTRAMSALSQLSVIEVKAEGIKAQVAVDGVKVKGLLDFSVEFDVDELPILTLSMRVASVNYQEDSQL